MKFKTIQTAAAPAPVGPYVQAIESGGMVFCSGQIALDPQSGKMVGESAEAQTEQVMTNIEAVLAAAGLSFENIVKSTIFLSEMASFSAVNAVYERRLGGHKPARSTVAVVGLPRAALVEIEVLAVR